MKYSDRPILRPSEDLLGRREFALTIAKAIDNLAIARDGFVMSIVGPWGSGKTSVIELVCRYLRHIEMERESQKTRTVGIAPEPRTIDELEAMASSYERVDELVISPTQDGADVSMWDASLQSERFERVLGTQSQVDDAILYWKLLRRVRIFPRTTVIRFSPWLIAGSSELSSALLSELARALGPRLGQDVASALAALLRRLAELAPVASSLLELVPAGGPLAKITNATLDVSAKRATELASEPSLDELRTALRKAMLRLTDQRVMVVVDDLDRLTPKETLSMASLVKGLGDMPNTIYLLGYDVHQMEQNLRRAKVDGIKYLEKIVQYEVWVPPPPDGSILDLFSNDLSTIFGPLTDLERNDLGWAWEFVLRRYLLTPRDVRLLANALAVPAAGLRSVTYLPDLVVVEAVRVFEPSLYAYIRSNLSNLAE